ncbi:MAG TPA: arsenate reductase (glutaredoxin) [Rheinheimera sp.]|nr:arsenate reductase (glutaredoxin) [Rheinheimera sp.]
MNMLTYFHNNRCSKSREGLTLVEQSGKPFQIRNYLTEPLTAAELTQLLQQLGITARQLLRTKEDAYQSMNLANPELSDIELISAMLQEPKLIERPILSNGQQAVIGRPSERLLELL